MLLPPPLLAAGEPFLLHVTFSGAHALHAAPVNTLIPRAPSPSSTDLRAKRTDLYRQRRGVGGGGNPECEAPLEGGRLHGSHWAWDYRLILLRRQDTCPLLRLPPLYKSPTPLRPASGVDHPADFGGRRPFSGEEGGFSPVRHRSSGHGSPGFLSPPHPLRPQGGEADGQGDELPGDFSRGPCGIRLQPPRAQDHLLPEEGALGRRSEGPDGDHLALGHRLLAGGEEDAEKGHRHHHRRLLRARPRHRQGPRRDRQMARHHGLPRLPQGRESRQIRRHEQGELLRHPPRPRLPRQRPPVRRQLPPLRPPPRRPRLQRRRLPPHRQGANFHRRRLRAQRGHQPPRPFPPRPPPPRRPQEVRLPQPPPHHRRLHHRQHEHFGRECAAQGGPGGPAGARRRAERAEHLLHDQRRRVRRRQGLQGQQGLQHAHHAGVPPAIPRGDGDHLRLPLPRLHRHHGALQVPHPPLQDPLPPLPEVHHQGLRLRGRIRQEARPGGDRSEPGQVGGLLELEQGLRLLPEPALRGGQRSGEGPEALGAQREARGPGLKSSHREREIVLLACTLCKILF